MKDMSELRDDMTQSETGSSEHIAAQVNARYNSDPDHRVKGTAPYGLYEDDEVWCDHEQHSPYRAAGRKSGGYGPQSPRRSVASSIQSSVRGSRMSGSSAGGDWQRYTGGLPDRSTGGEWPLQGPSSRSGRSSRSGHSSRSPSLMQSRSSRSPSISR